MPKPDFTGLARALPELHFDVSRDAISQNRPELQSYLKHYGIDLAGELPTIKHYMGRVPVAGYEISTHYWLPEHPKGVLTIVHGYFDHVGLYVHAIGFGLKHGLAVLAYDQPGHGLSSGERLAIDSFDRYGEVLEQLLRRSEHLFSGPRFALGQSMGGATLLNHLWQYGGELCGRTALCAPLILPSAWSTGQVLHWLLKRWLRQFPRKLMDSSHDEEFNDFLAHQDSLQEHYLSVAWVGAMKEWDQKFRTLAEREDSLLVVQGTGDGTVDWRYNLRQIQAKLPNSQVAMIDKARHHLINESEFYRAQVFEAVERFYFDLEQ